MINHLINHNYHIKKPIRLAIPIRVLKSKVIKYYLIDIEYNDCYEASICFNIEGNIVNIDNVWSEFSSMKLIDVLDVFEI